jgi:cell division transport system ATP-binding protein
MTPEEPLAPEERMAGSAPMMQLFRVCKDFGPFRHALADVSFTIERGEFVFLTGPSGAGKSTLLKLLFREELPTSGQILVNGRNIGVLPESQVPHFRRTLGVVFQDFKLIARKTVFENLAFVQSVLGLSRAEQKRRAYQALKRVGLHHRMNSRPPELSGGEQQRTAIALAIVNEPVLLLADEPTGNLDPVLSEEIMKLFSEINIRGTTVFVATHDVELIRRMGRRVLTLEKGKLHEPGVAREPALAQEAPFLPG